MTLKEVQELARLLLVAEQEAKAQRNAAFESDNPAECRKWRSRWDHFQEAGSAARSMILEEEA